MLLIPSLILVVIKGNIVSMPIKTGTEPGLNHIRARRMIAITGVERMVTSMGCRKALT
jgi:hypothetical protein